MLTKNKRKDLQFTYYTTINNSDISRQAHASAQCACQAGATDRVACQDNGTIMQTILTSPSLYFPQKSLQAGESHNPIPMWEQILQTLQ